MTHWDGLMLLVVVLLALLTAECSATSAAMVGGQAGSTS